MDEADDEVRGVLKDSAAVHAAQSKVGALAEALAGDPLDEQLGDGLSEALGSREVRAARAARSRVRAWLAPRSVEAGRSAR